MLDVPEMPAVMISGRNVNGKAEVMVQDPAAYQRMMALRMSRS
jgi:hypothetical protein